VLVKGFELLAKSRLKTLALKTLVLQGRKIANEESKS
jgi:hypothetical protein